jgi:dolichyldiphosphatase
LFILQIVLTPWFPWLASTRLAEFLMIRDDSLIPNVAWFEYTNSRGEAQKRLRKLAKNKSQ